MATADLRGHFGVAESTASNKAKQVRTLLNMHQFDHKWMLPSKLSNSSLPWMIQVNGLIVDARGLPVEIQEVAVQKGLIPYVYQQSDKETI